MITDPCYITDNNFSQDDYNKYLLDEKWAFFNLIDNGKHLIFSSGFGDGVYPVIAEFKNYGTETAPDIRIKKITIDLIQD